MPKLVYCYLEIFGSNFDAARFSVLEGVPKGDVFYQKSATPKLRSPVKAVRQGNVVYWRTDKKYFSIDGVDDYEVFHDYIYEEDFLIDFLNDHIGLIEVLKPFENETTEIWLVAIYEASINDRPSGMHIGNGLIMALNSLSCSFSTDIKFSDN
ncbi:hypothetical protein [Oceanobacter mangrovi]|uniref:hypothetical protein n=1 Tax=Oceanobacter mangrovi TaxID=2862510 RepID=UPI001C8DFF64|nr:hypothetical protein [Oceanobacter mangrovi]